MLLLVLPSSASGYTLGIFGNANEDDTINMQDVTFTELIILEFRDETQLADAKYDGEIDILDVTQIELIILEKEKELTLIDEVDRVVTVQKPVEKAVVTYHAIAAIVKTFGVGAENKVVGVADSIEESSKLFPRLSELPSVGDTWAPDAESVLSLEPDIVLTPAWGGETLAEQLEGSGIPVFCISATAPLTYTEDVKKIAYILGEKDSGDEFIDWYEGYIDLVKDRTEGLFEDDKPRILNTGHISGDKEWPTIGKDEQSANTMIKMAGGISITADLPGSWITVDPEWVLEQNPDIIYLETYDTTAVGYDMDDLSGAKAIREEIMTRPGVEATDAGKNEEVYVIAGFIHYRAWFICAPYFAKWFQPELFEDIDPNAIHQEYLTDFLRIDYDLDEHGIFVYHPQKHPDGK